MRERALHAWPLWSVLVAQAVLSLHWLWRTAAFTDEALYLRAGHQEWAHWLHHAAITDYASWFSGAPVVYPPLGAAADYAGGLAAARGLSLIFMMGATVMAYLAGRRLFGAVAGFFASALFAVSGLVVHYGAFATFDAMALFFLALGAWTAARAREGGYGWVACCAAALVAANAAKYATLAWDPVVISIAVLHGWGRGAAEAVGRGSSLTATVAVLEAGLLALGGAQYVRGVSVTTVCRTIHFGTPSPASAVLWRAFAITGAVVVPALLGVMISVARRNPLAVTALLGVLALAALIAPIDQARIHQIGSLDKNIGFGLPFAALGAGYAVSATIDWAGRRITGGQIAASAAGAALVLLVLIAGRLEAVQFRGPSSSVAARLVAAISHGYRRGTYILSDGAGRTEQFYLPSIPARAWMGIFVPSPALRARFRDRICADRVSIVILRLDRGTYDHAYDYQVRKLLNRNKHYRLAVTAGQGHYATQVWQLDPSAGGGSCT